MDQSSLDAIANTFASKFIARTDVKAEQQKDGKWHVHTTDGKRESPRIPWRREDLNAHVEGKRTFGHYLLNKDNQCKLFAFDVDLEKAGCLPTLPLTPEVEEDQWRDSFVEINDLRAAWLDRANPARDFMKFQFKEIAHKLLVAISKDLGLPCAAAYSGGKGIHVYAFTGLLDASSSREGLQIVLDSVGGFEPIRGENFVRHKDYPNLSIELFPKQNSLDGKDLGNLMRLPLGKNLKAPQEPTFFIDMIGPFAQMQPMDPITALSLETPWTPF